MTRDRQTDRRTDRQTSAPFHDMATRSGPHNKMHAFQAVDYGVTEIAGVDNVARRSKGGKRGSGQVCTKK